MNLDMLRTLGMTEADFGFIAIALKEDKMSLADLAMKLCKPLSVTYMAARAASREMLGEPMDLVAPRFFGGAQSYMDEKQKIGKTRVMRIKLLMALRAVNEDLACLESERGVSAA